MKTKVNIFLAIAISIIGAMSGCKKGEYGNYPGGVPYDVISVLDIRPIYKGQDVTLSEKNLYGGKKIQVVVISDHDAGNLPAGLLVVQDRRRVNTLRGISIDLGPAAANYHPGDSVEINIEGSTLTQQNGVLTLKGVTETKIKTLGTGKLEVNVVNSNQLSNQINDYESSLCMITKASFNPVPKDGEVISGEKIVNDGFTNFTLYTDPAASYANSSPMGLAAYIGIPFKTADNSFQFRTRKAEDMVSMGNSSLAQDLLIAGWQGDPEGGDGDYEYVQLLATKDIDFSTTPHSIVFLNSAGTSTPAAPDAGWATGDKRSIKWDITSGSVKKGQFFYFGGSKKMINGSNSTSLADSANWYAKPYATTGTNPGDGGLTRVSTFSTSGPFANSGNASGVAIFKGTTITEKSVPVDVFFIGTGGGTNLYDAAKGLGFRVCNNDWYTMVSIDAATLEPLEQPFYRSGSNTLNVAYHAPADQGYYYMMGGVYNVTLGRWTTARADHLVDLTKTSTLSEIESGLGGPNDEFITRLEE